MGIVVFTNILVRRNIDDIDKSFTSIYNDRLLPAAEIFYITELLYNERLVLEKYLLAGDNNGNELKRSIAKYSYSIDSILVELEKTYIVPNEALCLKEFKKRRAEYRSIEQNVIALSEQGSGAQAIRVFENEGVAAITGTIKHLHDLVGIQSTIGRELLDDSHHIVASANMLSFLEVGIAIVLGLLVHVIILTSRVFNKKSGQPFHLN